jgi:hypothetical protein
MTDRLMIGIVAAWLIGFTFVSNGLAGTPQKWDDLPKPVRDTVLANGGKEGMSVDKESGDKDGHAIYEAGVTGADGAVTDLVITDDGKLVEKKTDDAADLAAEREARAKKLLAGVKFSHPRDITNPYLPLAHVKRDILEGSEGGKKTRIERTAKPDVHKTFKVGEETVDSLAFEDRAYEDGQLAEVALDYFAQDDAGNVYYFGEDVDEYKDGKVVSHEGSWLFGKDTPAPGLMFPADPKLDQKWRSEDVSKEIAEDDEIVSTAAAAKTPFGDFPDCIKLKENLSDGTSEYKYYAKGVGVVREVPADGDELLVSHEMN